MNWSYQGMPGALPTWALTYPVVSIDESCRLVNIDVAIMIALTRIETYGQQYRCRYEPKYKNVLNVSKHAESLGITAQTEYILQVTSWGLCQLIGSSAREIGYNDHLTKLTDAALGIYWSAIFLKRLLEKHNDLFLAISCYNAGSLGPGKEIRNPQYVNKFKKHYFEMRRPLTVVR